MLGALNLCILVAHLSIVQEWSCSLPTELPKVMPPKGSKIEKLQSSLTCVKLLIGSRQIVTTTRGFLFSSQSPPHPQLQAQEAAEKWNQLWNPALLPQTTAVETLFSCWFACGGRKPLAVFSVGPSRMATPHLAGNVWVLHR